MYFYYMVSAMGPEYQKYIWWKKYLTTFQMVQFVAIFTHQFQLLFTECNYPKGFMVWIALHGVMFLFLFSDFYKVKYTNTKKSNQGLCMVSFTILILYLDVTNVLFQPVLDDEKERKRPINGKVTLNGSLNNSYIQSEYSNSYKPCYSNGINNGYVSQSEINGKKNK